MTTASTPTLQAVRGVDPDLWRDVRLEALKRRLTMGQILTEILREWLARQAT